MKFDSSSPSRLATALQISELQDLLASAAELRQTYATLERHPRIIDSPKSLELFSLCREQLQQDLELLREELDKLQKVSSTTYSESGLEKNPQEEKITHNPVDSDLSLDSLPDVEPVDLSLAVFEVVKRCFRVETQFARQLDACVATAQSQEHLKLQLQLKMIHLSAAHRHRLLEDRYGFARSKSLLLQGLRRQTTRFFSAIHGEKRPDIEP